MTVGFVAALCFLSFAVGVNVGAFLFGVVVWTLDDVNSD
jgi:hypothetical protein